MSVVKGCLSRTGRLSPPICMWYSPPLRGISLLVSGRWLNSLAIPIKSEGPVKHSRRRRLTSSGSCSGAADLNPWSRPMLPCNSSKLLLVKEINERLRMKSSKNVGLQLLLSHLRRIEERTVAGSPSLELGLYSKQLPIKNDPDWSLLPEFNKRVNHLMRGLKKVNGPMHHLSHLDKGGEKSGRGGGDCPSSEMLWEEYKSLVLLSTSIACKIPQNVHLMLAQICLHDGKVHHARGLLEDLAACAHSPSNAVWGVLAGIELKVTGDVEAALSVINDAIHLQEQTSSPLKKRRSFRPYVNIIRILMSLGDRRGVKRVTDVLAEKGIEPSTAAQRIGIGAFFASTRNLNGEKSTEDESLIFSAAMENMKAMAEYCPTPSELDVKLLYEGMISAAFRATLDGKCKVCNGRLRRLELTADETVELFDAVEATARNACLNPRIGKGWKIPARWKTGADTSLRKFKDWLQTRDERYTIAIDGPNVAYCGQAPAGQFSYEQVESVVSTLREAGERPLIILPSTYMKKKIPNHLRRRADRSASPSIVVTPSDAALQKKWNDEGCVMAVPMGYCDDWFWMYASLCDLKVVTNDRMRDHSFQRPDGVSVSSSLVYKWERAQMVPFVSHPKNCNKETSGESKRKPGDMQQRLGNDGVNKEVLRSRHPRLMSITLNMTEFSRSIQFDEVTGRWHVPIPVRRPATRFVGPPLTAKFGHLHDWLCVPTGGLGGICRESLSALLDHLRRLRLIELKMELHRRNLLQSGNKEDLVQRLAQDCFVK
eukprot:270174_1